MPISEGISYRQVSSVTTTLTVEKERDVIHLDTSANELTSEKSIDENAPAENTSSGWLWKVPSGIYQIGAGAIGLGVGTVKWAANSTCTVGTGIVSSGLEIASKVVKKPPKSKSE